MSDLFTAIDHTKEILQGRSFVTRTNPYPKYSKVYLRTNEFIASVLSKFDLSNYHRALTVLSSGDHVLNLIYKGINDIDSFDCNELTRYYALGLKIPMIKKFSYSQFLKALNIIKQSGEEIIFDTIPCMDEAYRRYWQEVLNFLTQNKESKLSNLFFYQEPFSCFPWYNNYLNSEKDYDLLKEKLASANISFTNCDVTELNAKFNLKYDIISLSNILAFFYTKYGELWDYSVYEEFEKSVMSMLSPQGIAYMFYAQGVSGGYPFFDNSLIYPSQLTSDNRREIIQINSIQQDATLVLKRE